VRLDAEVLTEALEVPIEVQDADARTLHTAIQRFLAQAVQHALDCGNQGDSDWRVYGVRFDGRRFGVVYDNPVRAWLPTGGLQGRRQRGGRLGLDRPRLRY